MSLRVLRPAPFLLAIALIFELTSVTFAGVPAPGTPGFQRSFRRGDANADGTVDLSDAVRTFEWLFLGLAPPDCLDAVDSNDDGKTDLSDGINTLLTLFRGADSIPYPGPDSCGLDPGPESLGCRVYSPCACGGFIGDGCAEGFFCEFPPGSCHIADLQGTCIPVPVGCPRVFDPVCGCDGKTYANDCVRQSAQVGLAHVGECGAVSTPVPFSTLDRGETSGAPEGLELHTDADSWSAFWTEHQGIFFPPAPVPEIDFDRQMVVTLVRHETSGGFHLVIDQLLDEPSGLRVVATIVEPSFDCPTTDALTQPFHFVVTEKLETTPVLDPRPRQLCCALRMQARAVGDCEKILGWIWTGGGVELLSGCECEGEDCHRLFTGPDEVLEAFHGCPVFPE